MKAILNHRRTGGDEHEAPVWRRIFRGSAGSWKRAGSICAALILGALALGLHGCAIEPGYGYYPDYSPYYADYGYSDGAYPFEGIGFGDIFAGGVRHHGYYGHHHFGHEFHGGHFGGGHFHGGGHFGGGGHHR